MQLDVSLRWYQVLSSATCLQGCASHGSPVRLRDGGPTCGCLVRLRDGGPICACGYGHESASCRADRSKPHRSLGHGEDRPQYLLRPPPASDLQGGRPCGLIVLCRHGPMRSILGNGPRSSRLGLAAGEQGLAFPKAICQYILLSGSALCGANSLFGEGQPVGTRLPGGRACWAVTARQYPTAICPKPQGPQYFGVRPSCHRRWPQRVLWLRTWA